MCGFVGVLNSTWDGSETEVRVRRATAAISHRGPDDFGLVSLAEGFAAGHVRLSIIDTSTAAHQPMTTVDGRFVIVFNGEIYNYRDLYRRFFSSDAHVNANSDTSVLLHLLARFGEEALQYLNGMFAFALYDRKTRGLFLARDRFGEKPLYWASLGARGSVGFCSEVRGLRALAPERVDTEDAQSLALFHLIGSIPAPRSAYVDVEAVKPASWVRISESGEIKRGEYWSYTSHVQSRGDRVKAFGDAMAETRQMMRDAVASRMVSDVPVGLFLSGGIDSGALLGFCRSQSLEIRSSLCLDFEEPGFSEVDRARKTADRYGVPLVTHVVTEQDFLESLPEFFRAMDQPTGDGYNTYFVSKIARRMGIKVWLSGVGGDELFGGYPSFERIRTFAAAARWIGGLVPISLAAPLGKMFRNPVRVERLMMLLRRGESRMRAYQTCRMPLSLETTARILASGVRKEVSVPLLDGVYPVVPEKADDYQAASILETLVYMQSQLLRDMDNFSMAHSIELRAPFLDHSLAEYELGVPEEFRSSTGIKKELLVRSLECPLPEEIVMARKSGFTFPVDLWLRRQLADHFAEVVLDPSNDGIWDMPAVEKVWRQCKSGHIHWSVLWNLYALAQWRANARAQSQ